MGKRTPFYDLHLKSHAKMVDFGGFDMPLHYGSQLEEHHQVRRHAGLFDVSHMGVVDIAGTDATAYLRYLIANNVDRLSPGQALYTCMLNEAGCVIDDLIVYKVLDNAYRLVINAGTRDKDLVWMRQVALTFSVELTERTDLVMLAIQGPEVKDKLNRFLPAEQAALVLQLKPFTFVAKKDFFIARTGYTGEAGYEVIFPVKDAQTIWDACLLFGVKPCGLGARDTLRLEAGMNLYGNDMDETVTPLESNLAWTVAFLPSERQFIGKSALEAQLRSGVSRQLVGLVLEGKGGIMRQHQKVWHDGREVGELTSGGYAPTLETSIGFARIAADVKIGAQCQVEMRDKLVLARVVKLPFVRQGKQVFSLVEGFEGAVK